MRIREGDPLEIYTSRDGEVIFKKYSLMGGLDDFAAQLCETMSRSTGAICAVTDRDSVIAVAGGAKRELLGKGITAQLEQVMENRRIYQYDGQGPQIPVSDSSDRLMAIVAAPILSEGDLLGLVLFISDSPAAAGTRSISWPRPSLPFWAGTWKTEEIDSGRRPWGDPWPPAILVLESGRLQGGAIAFLQNAIAYIGGFVNYRIEPVTQGALHSKKNIWICKCCIIQKDVVFDICRKWRFSIAIQILP